MRTRGGSGGDHDLQSRLRSTAQLRQCRDAITSQRYDAIVDSVGQHLNPARKGCARSWNPLIVDGTTSEDPDELKPQVEGVFGSVIWRPATAGEYTEPDHENLRRAKLQNIDRGELHIGPAVQGPDRLHKEKSGRHERLDRLDL